MCINYQPHYTEMLPFCNMPVNFFIDLNLIMSVTKFTLPLSLLSLSATKLHLSLFTTSITEEKKKKNNPKLIHTHEHNLSPILLYAYPSC